MVGWTEEANIGISLGDALAKVSYSWGSFNTGLVRPDALPQATNIDISGGGAVWVRPSPAMMGIPNKAGRYDGQRIRVWYSITGQQVDSMSNVEPLHIDGAISDFAATQYALSQGKFYNVDTKLIEDQPYEPVPPDEEEKPPPTPGPTPPSDDDFPTKPDSANPIDWMKWLVEVIIWGFKKLSEWIAWGIFSAVKFVWDSWPDWQRNGVIEFIKSWFAFWAFMFRLITKPRETIINMIKGFYAPGSPSVHEDIIKSAITNAYLGPENPQGYAGFLYDIINTIGKWGKTDIEILEGLIRQEVKIEGIKDVANAFYNKSKEVTLAVAGSALLTEWLSLGQVDGTDDFNDKLAELQGYPQVAAELRTVQAKANLGTMWEYFMNQTYRNKFPGTGELISIRRLELIEKDEFADVLAQQAGISEYWAEKLYASSLEPPTIDDYITYNLRHPDSAYELKDIMAIVNIDAERFGDIFEERKYVDPSITQARFMFEIKAIDRDQVFDIVRRNRFNTEVMEGRESSDAEDMTNYLTGFQTRIWLRQALLAGRANFIEGYVKEDELKEQAEELLPAEKAVDTYLQASKQKRMNWLADRYIKGFYTKEKIITLFDELGDTIKNPSELLDDLDKRRAQWERERQKLFTSSMLGRLLQDGEISPERLDEEVDLFDLSDERKEILKSWLKSTKSPEGGEEPV